MPTVWNPITKRMENDSSIVTSKKIIESSDGVKPNNGLHGVVTPLDQKLLKRNGSLDIYTVATNPELIRMFAQLELPMFESTSNGIYFEPIAKVMNGTQSYYVKWFCLRNDLSVSADHSYEYARIFEDGYLMKVMVPRSYNLKNEEEDITDFNILYLTPCKSLDVTEVSSRGLSSPTEEGEEEDPLNGVKDLYKITPFIPEMYPEISYLFNDREGFINTYLQDVSRMIQMG